MSTLIVLLLLLILNWNLVFMLECNCVGSVAGLLLLGRLWDKPVAHLGEKKARSLLMHGCIMLVGAMGAHRHVLVCGDRSVSISADIGSSSSINYFSSLYFGNSGLVFIINYRA